MDISSFANLLVSARTMLVAYLVGAHCLCSRFEVSQVVEENMMSDIKISDFFEQSAVGYFESHATVGRISAYSCKECGCLVALDFLRRHARWHISKRQVDERTADRISSMAGNVPGRER